MCNESEHHLVFLLFFANITDRAEYAACILGAPPSEYWPLYFRFFILRLISMDVRSYFLVSGRARLSSMFLSQTKLDRSGQSSRNWRGVACLEAGWRRAVSGVLSHQVRCPVCTAIYSTSTKSPHIAAGCGCFGFGWSPRCTVGGHLVVYLYILFDGDASHTNHFISSHFIVYAQYKEYYGYGVALCGVLFPM